MYVHDEQPEILSERFQRQETVTLGEALFLIDQVSQSQPHHIALQALRFIVATVRRHAIL